MSDKIGVGKVQSCGSTSSTREPLLRNDLGVASVNCIDMIGACTLDDQPLLPLEYDSHTTLEDLYNQVSSCIYCWLYCIYILLCINSFVNLNVYNFCIQLLMLE